MGGRHHTDGQREEEGEDRKKREMNKYMQIH